MQYRIITLKSRRRKKKVKSNNIARHFFWNHLISNSATPFPTTRKRGDPSTEDLRYNASIFCMGRKGSSQCILLEAEGIGVC